MAIGGAGWLRLPGRLWWRVSCGQDIDFDEVVGEDAMSAPGSGAVDAGEMGAVPSVASLEVVDSSFGLRGQQQRDQAQAAVRRITGNLPTSPKRPCARLRRWCATPNAAAHDHREPQLGRNGAGAPTRRATPVTHPGTRRAPRQAIHSRRKSRPTVANPRISVVWSLRVRPRMRENRVRSLAEVDHSWRR